MSMTVRKAVVHRTQWIGVMSDSGMSSWYTSLWTTGAAIPPAQFLRDGCPSLASKWLIRILAYRVSA
jgi:hypothetical protein